MGKHIRRDLTWYTHENVTFTTRATDLVAVSIKSIAGQVAALLGIYDENDNLLGGFQADGDIFAPDAILNYGDPDQFSVADFYADYSFGDNTQYTLNETTNHVEIQTEDSGGTTLYGCIPLSEDPDCRPAAEFLSETKTYVETISALKLVNATSQTHVQIADPSTLFEDSKTLGLATSFGNSGDQRPIILFGKVEDVSFNYTVNTLLYLDVNGSITDVPPSLPTSQFSVNIGYSLGTGAIFLNIQEPIELV